MINFGIEHFQYRYLKPSDPIFKYNYDCISYIKDTKEDNFGSLNFYKSNAYSKYKYGILDYQHGFVTIFISHLVAVVVVLH